jgi:uncharacterized protein YbaP (TraB family)
MLVTIENFKNTLNLLPLPEDIKDNLIKSSEVILEFRSFISNKYEITAKDADEKIQKEISNLSPSINDADLDRISTSASDYAKSEGWDKHEEIKKAIVDMYNSINELQSLIG